MNDAYAQEQATTKWPAIWLGLHGAIAVLGVLLLAFLVMDLKATGQSTSAWVLVGVMGVLLVIQAILTAVGQEAFVAKKRKGDPSDGNDNHGLHESEPVDDPWNHEATGHGRQEV